MLRIPNGLLTRRVLLRGSFAATVGAVVTACTGKDQSSNVTAGSTPTLSASASGVTTTPSGAATIPTCVVRPEETEGPFFVDEKLNRSDIRSDPSGAATREGMPLRLVMTVSAVSGSACAGLGGAQVDVWHCDARGIYSDVAANGSRGQKFLRGYQVADSTGRVEFQTIYPGWYSGRSIHIHFKVRSASGASKAYEVTSQIFFDENVSDRVMSQAPYNNRGNRDTRNQADMVFTSGGNSGAKLMADLSPDGAGYVARFDLGLAVG
jgi:protocatechuate 3,4-dioxygenase beta subunit